MHRLPPRSCALLIAALFLGACADPIPLDPGPKVLPQPRGEPITPSERIELRALVADAWSVEAVAVDGDRVLSLLPGRGVLVTDRAGRQLDLYAFGEDGFPDLGYGDLDVLPDGRFVLAAPDEAVTWDPETHALESYFCLEPGWGEVVMINQALTVDQTTGRILGAPTYYDTMVSFSEPMSSFHVSYAFDGESLATVDVLGSGIVAEGLAALPDGRLLAVDGNTLAAFDSDGAVLETWQLTGVADASGLAIDADGRLLVTDRADLEIRAFDLADL